MSARLLITLNPDCDFTPAKFQQYRRMHPLEGSHEEMTMNIHRLEKSEPSRLMLLIEKVEDLRLFARSVEYAYVELHGSFEDACRQLEDKISKIPLTGKDLPHVDPRTIGGFYLLLGKVQRIFRKNNLFYWAIAGTLLGAVRHRSMIPWDDDVDLGFLKGDDEKLEQVRKDLNKEDLELHYRARGDFYKIFPRDGICISDGKGGHYPWKYPFVDLFRFEEEDGTIRFVIERLHQAWPFYEFSAEKLKRPLEEAPFGPLRIPVPHDSINLVADMFGKNWNTEAYVKYDHKKEEEVEKVRVDLVECNPAEYVLDET